MPYVRPQVTLQQLLTRLPAVSIASQSPLIVGPAYHLFRYAEADEKAMIGFGAYDKDEGNTGAWPSKPGSSIVDTNYAKLVLDDALLKYATVTRSATNPVNAVSANALHKLRAAPRISSTPSTDKVGSVVMTSGGFFQGLVGLPESYYFWPQANFTMDSAAGVLDYSSTEGLEGEVDVPAETTGATVQGPHGLTAVFTSPGAVMAPMVITFTDDGAAGVFTLSLKPSAYKAVIDSAIDSALPATISHTDAAMAGMDLTGYVLALPFEAADTLAQIRAAIVLVPGLTDLFDVSAIVGTGDGTGCTIEDSSGAVDPSVTTAIEFLQNVWRVKVYENTWVWKTENDVPRTASFLRDVKIGDRVRATLTPAGGDEVSIDTRVVGFESDYTLPTIADAAADADNTATQTGDDVSAGEALVEADTDNARLFDGAGTEVFSLSADSDFMDRDLANGIVAETITITITTTGAEGTALAKVSNASGTYVRYNVKIENVGSNDGQIYIGNNLYVNFEKGDGEDGIFQTGDVYTVAADAAFTAVTEVTSSGTYDGDVDTTYRAEVVRGGVFTRSARCAPGLTQPGSVPTVTPVVSAWTGGDVDDEYILEVTGAGTLTTSIWKVTSLRGDTQTGIVFTGTGIAKAVGSKGLTVSFATSVTFAVGQYYVIKVYGARPQVRISDSAGMDQLSTVVVNSGVVQAMGLHGAYITFASNANSGLLKGDVFTVAATASAATSTQTLVLAHPLPSTTVAGTLASGDANASPDLVQIELFLQETGIEVPRKNADPDVASGSVNWTATTSAFTVNPDLKLQSEDWVDDAGDMPYLSVESATMLLQYRALRTNLGSLSTLTAGLGGVVAALGKVDNDNPLALAVYKALENAGAATVYFVGIVTDDAAGYNTALSLVTATNLVYAIAVCSNDSTIMAALKTHVLAMSTKTYKKWRMGFVSPATPSQSTVLAPSNNDGDAWLATITDDTRSSGTSYTKVTLSTDADLLTRMAAGDQVRLQYSVDAWGDETYTTHEVAEVESDTVFYLVTALDTAVNTPSRIEAYHPLSDSETADAVEALSASFASERMIAVFMDPAINGDASYPGFAVAAAIAALACSVPPQQGITNVSVNGFTGSPSTYSRFTPAELDVMAGGGTLIIAQDTETGTIYVRHQVTSAYSDGVLSTGELSMVKNRDSVSYAIVAKIEPWIGRYNVTPELLENLRTNIEDIIARLGSLTGVGLLGPQILLEGSEVVSLVQSTLSSDTIEATVRINFPSPLNKVDIVLEFG